VFIKTLFAIQEGWLNPPIRRRRCSNTPSSPGSRARASPPAWPIKNFRKRS